jgi:hypothetical protein
MKLAAKITAAVVFQLLWVQPQALAQASLVAENIRPDVDIELNGQKYKFTLIRDARAENQWYYVPNEPRLWERQVGGNTLPEFALVRYQSTDPSNAQKIVEGGILQFSVTYAASEVIGEIAKKLSAQSGVPVDKIRISALQPKSAEVNLYAPDTKLLLASAALGEGVAPTFATQKMAFSLALTGLGTNVFEALTTGNTGVGVAIVFKYQGIVPAANFKVEVDWDQTFDYYSKNERFRARASWYGWFGGGADVNNSEVRSTLIQNKMIKVTGLSGEDFPQEKVDAYLQPILAAINAEMLENFKAPQNITPAVADEPSTGSGFFGGVGYSVATKKITEVKKGKQEISFGFDKIVERQTAISGFVGIGRYPDSVKSQLITFVKPGPFTSAFLLLPSVGDAPALNISEISLQTNLEYQGSTKAVQTVRWTPKSGWVDKDGAARTVVSFPLIGLGIAELKQANFRQTAQIVSGLDVLQVERLAPAVNGDVPLTTPVSLVDVITVDPTYLTFSGPNPQSRLANVAVELKSGSRTGRATLRPIKNGSDWQAAAPFTFLVEKPSVGQPPPVIPQVIFRSTDGTEKKWSRSGSDIRAVFPDLLVTFFDADWQK